MLIDLKNVKYEIGAEEILKDVNLSVNEKDKIGIIGPNGAGKTTLLRLMTGEIAPSDGEIFKVQSKKICYVAQNSGLDSCETVIDEFLKPFSDIVRLEKRIAEIEQSENGEKEELAQLYERFDREGGLTYKSRINAVLAGLGFTEDAKSRKISSLSEGQKTKLALGRALISEPDILLLDEPTNHLDTDSIVWLEGDLKKFAGTLLVVSHDRMLLDSVTNRTLFVEFGRIDSYSFPYAKANEVREADKKYQESCYLKQQKQIEKIKAVIKQQQQWNREKNIVTAESWMKKLERMTLIEKAPSEGRTPAIVFKTDEHGCKDVLDCRDVSFGYTDRNLFEHVDLYVRRGERVFISGKNGCGKSTFLKLITGDVSGYSGKIRLGDNLTFSYYRQNMEDLNPENTVFDEIWDHANKDAKAIDMYTVTEIRNALGAFNFTGEDVFKKISDLSGGEKARVSLLKICFNDSQLLILDEPTNHLDIRTRETIEKAINNFKGTVIAVSHDRYFVSKIATKIFDISEYAPEEEKKEKNTKNKDDYLKAKELESNARKKKTAIERNQKRIEEVEALLKEKEKLLEEPEISSDYNKLAEICDERDRLSAELEALMEEFFALNG